MQNKAHNTPAASGKAGSARNSASSRIARECMVTALIQLLKEKPLSAISVSEITAKAGVSRMTYYRNYQNKEDIFLARLKDVMDCYRKETREIAVTKNYWDTGLLEQCFIYLKDNDELLKSMFQSGLDHLFLNALTQFIIEFWQKPEDDLEHLYSLQAFAGSLYNLYIFWAANGEQETPAQMAQILHRIYAPSI